MGGEVTARATCKHSEGTVKPVHPNDAAKYATVAARTGKDCPFLSMPVPRYTAFAKLVSTIEKKLSFI